jgi:hypothetical protein
LQYFRGGHGDRWIGRHGRQQYRRDHGNGRKHESGHKRNRRNDHHHNCFGRWYKHGDGGIERRDDHPCDRRYDDRRWEQRHDDHRWERRHDDR